MNPDAILPAGWDARQAADEVMAGLVNVCRPQVKGAHDSDFRIVGDKAYVVYMANDVQPGEAPNWPFVYNALSIVNITSGAVEHTETFAASEMVYENETLPTGACFVPRIIQRDDNRLRCFFASEDPGHRESQTWHIDFDLTRQSFEPRIHRASLETPQGVFPMQPGPFHAQAAAQGLTHPRRDSGLYMIDALKVFDGQVHCVLNNFPVGQNAWARLDVAMERFTVLGNFFRPTEVKLTESAVNRLPDGSWLAISRREGGDRNYLFSRSPDGKDWGPHKPLPVVTNGTSSKPAFERFGGLYYLGWQDAARIGGAFRSIFNVEVSRDGENWERKYRFESDKSFQYPTFREAQGSIYVSVTQGDHSDSRKERIMFGRVGQAQA